MESQVLCFDRYTNVTALNMSLYCMYYFNVSLLQFHAYIFILTQCITNHNFHVKVLNLMSPGGFMVQCSAFDNHH